ncbi:MAG: AraC family transcriptional regulator [Cyanobacteria bacterium P01_C01_bin.73]
MKASLSFTDIQDVIQELQQQTGGGSQFDTKETALFLPRSLGQGYLRGLNLRDGLDLFIQEYELKEDLVIDASNLSTQQSFITFAFCMSGETAGNIPGFKPDLGITAGQNFFATIPDAAGTSELRAGQKITTVSLTTAPTLLMTLLEEDLHQFPADWQQRFQNAATTPYFQPNYNTPEISHILQLILHCPHKGGIRRFYLEAKALELLAICIAQLTHYYADASPLGWVKSKDVDGLYRARDILLQNINTPPSLTELTQQVDINERNLQKGFQRLFGTTVFGVLHDYRMELARQLLEADQMSIGAIANAVGISHRGYFAAAFKRKFGVTPREYLKRFIK